MLRVIIFKVAYVCCGYANSCTTYNMYSKGQRHQLPRLFCGSDTQHSMLGYTYNFHFLSTDKGVNLSKEGA